MRIPILFLIVASVTPAVSKAVAFTNLDDFSQSQSVSQSGLGTSTDSSITTLSGLFTRTLTAVRSGSGGGNAATISVANGTLTLTAPPKPTDLTVKYSAIDASGVSFSTNTSITVGISSAQHANAFSWVLTDVYGHTALWTLNYTSGAHNYTESFGNFTYTTFDWTSVKELTFSVNLNLGSGSDTTVINLLTAPGSSNSGPAGAPPVPEPSTYGLGLGALALATVAVRRRIKKA